MKTTTRTQARTHARTLASDDWDVVRRSVQYLILAECGLPITIGAEPVAWFDTRPMYSPHEHCGSVIDWHCTVVAFATMHGLVAPHPREPHLVRMVLEEVTA